eukprot:scaffold179357_cov19-Tisochrysis_lutea.AAC.5
MAEVERFQQLAQEKEALNERWDEQNSLLVESHERVIAELTEDYEAKLAEESLRLEQLLTEKTELEREFEEIKRQLEEDADREIEELKEKYEDFRGHQAAAGGCRLLATEVAEPSGKSEGTTVPVTNTLLYPVHSKHCVQGTPCMLQTPCTPCEAPERLAAPCWRWSALLRAWLTPATTAAEQEGTTEGAWVVLQPGVRLAGEREASLRLKGENGIMRKKFNALQKDIEAQKEEIKNLFEQETGGQMMLLPWVQQVSDHHLAIGERCCVYDACLIRGELHLALLAARKDGSRMPPLRH